ncbi:flavoprotein, partial [Chloroflexota bacterium]
VLATEAPVVIAPSMNDNMYKNPVTQENIKKLMDRGFTIVEPEEGRLASGKIGVGRLADVQVILNTVKVMLGKKK